MLHDGGRRSDSGATTVKGHGTVAREEKRSSILGAVKNPLGFFSLSLMVIEVIFGLVVGFSKMTGDYQFISLCIMAGLFVIVVSIMTWLTVKRPKHFYEEIVEQIGTSRAMKEFINSPAFRETIEDVLQVRVRPECLQPLEREGSKS
jgi:hypothetical protein